jgi:hypothetical protein
MKNTANSPIAYYSQSSTSDFSSWGKSVAQIDAPASRVLGWLCFFMSCERVLKHKAKKNNLLRFERNLPNSRTAFQVFEASFPSPVTNRVFATYCTWKSNDEGSFTFAFSPITQENYPAINDEISLLRPKAVRGSVEGAYLIKPQTLHACEVTLVTRGDLAGKVPKFVMDMRVKSALSTLRRIQDKYERNAKQVDAEFRDSFLVPPRLLQLATDQRAIVNRCIELETAEDLSSSSSSSSSATPSPPRTDLKSPTPLVKMQMRRTPRSMGLNGEFIGIAELVVDCSAKDALAWWFQLMSREQVKRSAELGNLAHLLVKEYSPHDNVVALIKKMPPPLYHREFVFRQVCVSVENNEFLSVLESTEDVVDYGSKMKTVRAFVRALARITPTSDSQCRFVLYRHLKSGGAIPAFVVNSKIPEALADAVDIRNEFQRDNEIDEVERNELARVIAREPQDQTADESALLDRVKKKLGKLKEDEFVEMESPDHFVQMRSASMKSDNSALFSASTVIDAPIEVCVAWDFLGGSREKICDFFRSKSGLEHRVIPSNDHCAIRYTAEQLSFLAVLSFTKGVWSKLDDGNKIEMAYEPCDPTANFHYADQGRVTALYTTRLVFERLAPIRGTVAQTRVSLRGHFNLRGSIPLAVIKAHTVRRLLHLSRMRWKFDKSAEIDAANMAEIVETIKNHSAAYSKEENEAVDSSLQNFTLFEEVKAKKLKSDKPTTVAKIATKGSDSLLWGWSSTIVRASPEQIVSLVWDTFSRTNTYPDTAEKAIDEEKNGHNKLIYLRKRTIKFISDRDFYTRCIWKKDSKGNYIYVTVPEEGRAQPHSAGVVRATFPSTYRLTRLHNNRTRIELVVHPDPGGSIPRWVSNLYVAKQLFYVTSIEEYFQELRGIEEYDAYDGRAVGESMVIKTQADKFRELTKARKRQGNSLTASQARMRFLFRKYKGLKEIGRKYCFFEEMMARIVQNKLRSAQDMGTKLCNLTAKEGATIGAGLAMSLASSLTAEAAVDEWIWRYPALLELDRAEVWFRPMVTTVAFRLLGDVPWGMQFRVFTSAGLSMLDLASDINVVLLYRSNPDTMGYATTLLGMIFACTFLQLIIVYAQNKKKPLKLVTEALIVFTGLKPGYVQPYDIFLFNFFALSH